MKAMTSSDDHGVSASPPPRDKKGKSSFGMGALVGGVCIAGAYGSGLVGSNERYPMRAEYEITDACIRGSEGRIFRDDAILKKELCLCALEKSQVKISYSVFKKKPVEFMDEFRASLSKCRK